MNLPLIHHRNCLVSLIASYPPARFDPLEYRTVKFPAFASSSNACRTDIALDQSPAALQFPIRLRLSSAQWTDQRNGSCTFQWQYLVIIL